MASCWETSKVLLKCTRSWVATRPCTHRVPVTPERVPHCSGDSADELRELARGRAWWRRDDGRSKLAPGRARRLRPCCLREALDNPGVDPRLTSKTLAASRMFRVLVEVFPSFFSLAPQAVPVDRSALDLAPAFQQLPLQVERLAAVLGAGAVR